MTAAAKLRDQGDTLEHHKPAMKFYRRYVDESEPEEITEELFCERFKEDFKDPWRFIDFMKKSTSPEKPFQYGAAEYWFEKEDE